MSGTALALVLAAALLHATWNLAAKGVGSSRVAFIWLYVVASAAIWVPVGVLWVVVTGERPTWTWLGAAAVSSALHIVYQLVLQRGYAEGDLNLVYPLARGTGPAPDLRGRGDAARRAARARRPWRASSPSSRACC